MKQFFLKTIILIIPLIVFMSCWPNISLGASPHYYSQNTCTKEYYKPTDLVGYFYDSKNLESYYIAFDWCVVKPILWYGTIFGWYDVDGTTLSKNINYIFPETQVYFGMIPSDFISDGGGRIQKGKFTTAQHRTISYFLNDNPFKNIFGGNYTKPPRYVPEPAALATPQGDLAPMIMRGMQTLYDQFSNQVMKGQCSNPAFYQKNTALCTYFSSRTVPFVPPMYGGYTKLPAYQGTTGH